jgi:surfeit locus 1 family protein
MRQQTNSGASNFPPTSWPAKWRASIPVRPDVSGPGFFVFAPARLPDGGIVVLDRGFVPEAQQARAGAIGEAAGPSEIIGALRWPEQRGTFAAKDDLGHNLWFTRDHRAMAGAKGWDRLGQIAPFYVAVEAPEPPGGLPRPGALRPVLRNEHLQYALTWFGLAAVLAIAFPLWVRSRRREANSE